MTEDVQKLLDQILDDLESDDTLRQLEGIQTLEKVAYSSKAILFELEHLAIHGMDDVRVAALAALGSKTNQYISKQLSKLSRLDRQFVLKQIEFWEENELIEPHRAEVLRRRHDFDTKLRPASKTVSKTITEVLPAISPVVVPAVPAGPRPSLMQTLLSEASIKVYLYLGSFFVIASALILAAIVQAARLPILAVATLAFGGGALLIRRRLPQPSFALFIVFSFLLPIDANVFEETLGLAEPILSIYWTIIFLVMAFIWSFSTWFYESRFFSVVDFVSLSFAFYRAGGIFQTERELNLFLLMIGALVGLEGVSLLKKWKDDIFASPLFWAVQAQTIFLLMASFIMTMTRAFEPDFANGWWILIALTWILAASFYVLSDSLIPFVFFPWMAAATLLPISWFFLNAFDSLPPAQAFGFWVWGTVFALGSEVLLRPSFERIKKFHWPLLMGSVPLFLASFSTILLWNKPGLTFAIFGATALVYTSLHFIRQRWFIWSGALLSAVCAYFTFFFLPAIEKASIPFVYQLLLASVLLVTPELFAKSPLSFKSESRWPAIAFGIFISLICLTTALVDFDHGGRTTLVLMVYAILFIFHALHSKQHQLGYFAAASASLAVIYTLPQFNLDLWLPALTVLSLLYYSTGFLVRNRADMKAWGNMLINSGLILGALLSLISLVMSKETSGWYILVVALLFALETFARPLALLEVVVEVLLSISLYRILDDFNVTNIGHFLFGASIIWLGSEMIFGRFLQEKRLHRPMVLSIGYILVFLSAFILWDGADATPAMIYFILYAAFFALYAFLQREPRLGYLATVFVPLAVIKLYDVLNFEKWIFPLIALSVLYYVCGFLLRRNQKATGWDIMLLYSGLGLAVFISFSAPFQGRLDASISVAIAATLFAVEAFSRREVWLALPANLLYLMSYFMILTGLNVEEPQFYSIGAALLGMLMHYLLTRAGSKTGAFIAGMLSQFVLLGTTYVQMASTSRLMFFFVLFAQSMIVLVYGLIQRSRSLVITPIAFAVLGVVTVIYSALKGLSSVVLIGCTGVVLLMLGIVAVILRERITRLGEQLSEWRP
jgi:hypothetical protein